MQDLINSRIMSKRGYMERLINMKMGRAFKRGYLDDLVRDRMMYN